MFEGHILGVSFRLPDVAKIHQKKWLLDIAGWLIGSLMSTTHKVTSTINEIWVSGSSMGAGIVLDEHSSMFVSI